MRLKRVWENLKRPFMTRVGKAFLLTAAFAATDKATDGDYDVANFLDSNRASTLGHVYKIPGEFGYGLGSAFGSAIEAVTNPGQFAQHGREAGANLGSAVVNPIVELGHVVYDGAVGFYDIVKPE